MTDAETKWVHGIEEQGVAWVLALLAPLPLLAWGFVAAWAFLTASGPAPPVAPFAGLFLVLVGAALAIWMDSRRRRAQGKEPSPDGVQRERKSI